MRSFQYPNSAIISTLSDIKSGDVLTVNRNGNLLTMNFPAYEPKIVNHSLEELYSAFGVRPTLFLYCKYGLVVFNNEEEIGFTEQSIYLP